jgi:hypothetical protein
MGRELPKLVDACRRYMQFEQRIVALEEGIADRRELYNKKSDVDVGGLGGADAMASEDAVAQLLHHWKEDQSARALAALT